MAPRSRTLRLLLGAALFSAGLALPLATATAIPIPSVYTTPCNEHAPEPSMKPPTGPVVITPEPSAEPPVVPGTGTVPITPEPTTESVEPSLGPEEEVASPEPSVPPNTGAVDETPEPSAVPLPETPEPVPSVPMPSIPPPSTTPSSSPSPSSSLAPSPYPVPEHPKPSDKPNDFGDDDDDTKPHARCHMRNFDLHKGTAERCCNMRFACGSPQCHGSRACENPDMCYCRKPVCRKVYIHFSYEKELSGDCAYQVIKL